MATLTGNSVGTSYLGLLKTTDNAVIGATEKNLTDGGGNASTLSVGTASASFTGTLNLANATVTGLDAAGLVAGTGTDSMKSADSLTTTAANALGTTSIAIGNDAKATGTDGIGIGNDANAEWINGISIGTGSWAQSQHSIGIGANAHGRLGDGIAIGRDSQAAGVSGTALGLNAQTNLFASPIAIGVNTIADADNAVALGTGVTASTADTVSVKALETQTPSTPSAGGVIMTDAASVARRLNINSSGILLVDSTPVSGGSSVSSLNLLDGDLTLVAGSNITITDDGLTNITINANATAAGLVSGTGTNSMKSDDSLTNVSSLAQGNRAIAIGDGAIANSDGSISLGSVANVPPSPRPDYIAIGQDIFIAQNSIAIGKNTNAQVDKGVVIGYDAFASGNSSVAVGKDARCTGLESVAIGNNTTATAGGAVAIGNGVTAAKVNTTTVAGLETLIASTPTAGGIVMVDAGSTDRRLNINASGVLQVDSTPVSNVAPVYETPSFVISAQASSDICYTVVTIPANTYADGDVLEFRSMVKTDSLNNTAYQGWYISEQSQTPGTAVVTSATAKQIAGTQSNANGALFYQKTLWLTTGNMTTWPYGVANETSSTGVLGGDPIETQTVDWTTTQYLYCQVWQDSTTGTLTNYGGLLRKIN